MQSNSISHRQRQRHRIGMLICALALGAAAPWLADLSLSQQFWIVLLPVMVFGMSHGGADPLLIAALKRVRGRGNAQWFGGYLALMLLTVAFIWWQPAWALVIFLLMSAAHFAATDRPFLPAAGFGLAGWLSGSLPIVAPMFSYPDQVATLFAWLLQAEVASLVPRVAMFGQWLMGAWLVLLLVTLLQTQRSHRLSVFVELIALAAPLLLLPPLLAFTFYFCVVHSLRHFMMLMAAQRNANAAIDVKGMARVALPATLGAIGLSLIAWWGLHALQPSLDVAWVGEGVRVMFWGLAVLTVPHALVVALWSSPQVSRRA
ncbi:MAG: Brp/Blh family beta-carotene 15,15'-dioxygenase [Halopseudomonas sp.]